MQWIANEFKIQFFSIIYLINSLIRDNGISHSLYVKFEMWTALFCVNYLSYLQ